MKKSIIDKIFWIPNLEGSHEGIKEEAIWIYYVLMVYLIAYHTQDYRDLLLRALLVIIFFNLMPYQIYRLVRKIMGKKDD